MEDSDISFIHTRAKISELPQNPEQPSWGATEASAYSSKISHDQKGRSPLRIWEEDRKNLEPRKIYEKNRKFLRKLAEQGHSSCFYQSNVGINYEIPRHIAMFLCSFDHPKYLQQSQRYTKAKEFVSFSENDTEELYSKQRDLYMEMIEEGVNKEDARFILPIGVGATHLHQNINLVGFANIYRVMNSDNALIPKLTTKTVDEAFNSLNSEEPNLFSRTIVSAYNKNNKGYPVANMFNKGNTGVNKAVESYSDDQKVSKFEVEVEKNLLEKAREFNDEALSFLNLSNSLDKVGGFVAPMSLSAWHQFMRNDTVKQSIESLYDAAERSEVVVPKSVSEEGFEEEFVDLFDKSMKKYSKLKGELGKHNAVEVIPHALRIYTAFSLDGFNLIKGFIEDRAVEAAQWEIRGIARQVKEIVGR